ncbi:hypothetical protein FIBSPDRAFT_964748 [Athelia psychrophila]|uniref:Uncharacterized protein n=1 Tax=Athelia psychrophila TaxID=1759441 RepID=A0A165XFX0_9AGAM|nr:hypothetical protein FIBSPDRAFT_964748 [Fibularhizoctonia sp. CBS 109695]
MKHGAYAIDKGDQRGAVELRREKLDWGMGKNELRQLLSTHAVVFNILPLGLFIIAPAKPYHYLDLPVSNIPAHMEILRRSMSRSDDRGYLMDVELVIGENVYDQSAAGNLGHHNPKYQRRGSPVTRTFPHLTIPFWRAPIIPDKANQHSGPPTASALSRDATSSTPTALHAPYLRLHHAQRRALSEYDGLHGVRMRLCHHRLIAVPYRPHSHQDHEATMALFRFPESLQLLFIVERRCT